MNAANANQNALDNAAPNSRVGRIATYQSEAIRTGELDAEAAAALAALEALPAPSRTSVEIQADIDAAILAGTDTSALDAELADALAYEAAATTALAAAAAAAEQAAIEAAALEAAANKDVPEGDALEALRAMLGLD
ncbi:hypothetical protein [Abyssibius alkaniclasticus]|uniref:hypothetical protein n=1 Tax=Abyssibius alkaniclasticus TaxID=2881234 RepID=UPI00405A0107